ncbi:follistatin-like [Planococcus citri]|uniref:follistatin-like n=1 Tax=Planococcus citri TaxID=170843 RepID=UPI0031F89727
MSFLNYRDIRTFFTIFLLASIQCLPTVLGGICWTKMTNKKGYCKEILKNNISQENCCSETDASTAYTAEDYRPQLLFFLRAMGDGVPCKPCKETCESLQCEVGKKCVVKQDRPTCICAPKCKHQKNTKKGPVCGTDARTYKSLCRLKKRACRTNDQTLNVNYYGLCQSSCQNVKCPADKSCVQDQNLNAHCVKCNFCSNRTPSNPRRVCGIDGITYRSACHLRQISCLNGRSITTAYEGRCKSNASCKNIRCPRGEKCLMHKASNLPRCVSCSECPKWKTAAAIRREMGGPICGTNNQTYDSWCFMVEDSCRLGYVVETQFAASCQTGNKSLEFLDNSVMGKFG